MRIDLVEGSEDALTERLGLLDCIGGVDAAGIHHHGRHQAIEVLAIEGALGRRLELGDLPGIDIGDVRRHRANADDDGAHDGDDEQDAGPQFHCSVLEARRHRRGPVLGRGQIAGWRTSW
jgi:hypothetical protein